MNSKEINKVCSSVIAEARSRPASGVRMTRNASQVMRRPILPNTNSPWMSLEIECFFPKRGVSWNVISKAIAEVGLHKFVRLKDDGSIESDYLDEDDWSCEAEVVITAPESKILTVVEKVCCVLNSLGAKTNDSCGLHIHVDHRPALKRNPLVSYNNLYYIEDLLFKVSDPSREDSDYCERLYGDNPIQGLTHLNINDYSDDDRYRSINVSALDAHNTIEIRVFHGTTKFQEIKHFINLVLGAVNSKTMFTKRIGLRNLNTCKSIPLETRKFIKTKYRRAS